MRFADLIDAVQAQNPELSKVKTEAVVRSFLATIANTLQNGDKIDLLGIGVLKPKTNAARQRRNIQTGETIDCPESRSVRFAIGTRFRAVLNGKV